MADAEERASSPWRLWLGLAVGLALAGVLAWSTTALARLVATAGLVVVGASAAGLVLRSRRSQGLSELEPDAGMLVRDGSAWKGPAIDGRESGDASPENDPTRLGGTADRGRITIDDDGVRRDLPDGSVESIRWCDLLEVAIFISDDPREDDFFALLGPGDSGCAVPHSLATEAGLLVALEARLHDLDWQALYDASTSLESARFTFWRRDAAPASDTAQPG